MHVDIEGPEDAPTLVLLHGGIGTGRYHWSKLVPALSAEYRVHMPDLPGHGRTPLPDDGRYDRGLLVGAVQDLLERLTPPVTVAGFSMGGHTALALAAKHPDLFAALILVGVSVAEHPRLDRWRARFNPDRLQSEYPLWARALSKLHAPLGGPDAWRDVCRRDSGGLEVVVDLGALAAFAGPALLIRGDRDQAVDPAHYSALRRTWPQAEEFVVPGGGHDVQLTRSPAVGPVLLDFLHRASR